MAKVYGKAALPSNKKCTSQGSGLYTKKSHSGGETFHNNHRSGSPPSKRHRNRKPQRGQGR